MFSLRIAKPRILLRITKRRRKLIMGSNQKGDPVRIIGVKESQSFKAGTEITPRHPKLWINQQRLPPDFLRFNRPIDMV